MIGRRINDRYKLIEKIGSGGMADVFLARDVILERYVAVKILRLDFANDEEFIRRFHREAQSATSLVHPNIVNIYDVGEESDNIYYIVMEYVNGETLKNYIQNHSPLPVVKAIDIMKQIVSAIKHAHQNNIIHRDIKPQNILIDKKGTIKVTDFGIAMAQSSTTITHSNTLLGSVHYISPEQARGGIATKKSDIYSIGIVMYELLTGRLPFQGESAVSIALKHLQDETPSPRKWNPEIPQSVENIILKATSKDPNYRYKTIEDLEDDLFTCLEPSRINEPPFQVPVDNDATKAIPIIHEGNQFAHIQESPSKENEATQTEQTTKQNGSKKKRKIWPIILLSASGLIILSIIFFLTIFPSLFGPKDIEVPDVSNIELEEAKEELEELGFKIGEIHQIPHDTIKENYVISTDPRAGKKIVEGSTIDIYVSVGKESLTLPDYTGRSFQEVLTILQSQSRKFKDIRTEEVFDESESGTILEQTPSANTDIIPEDTVLIFKVSKGPETFELADLTEFSKNALEVYATGNGIKINIASEDYHDTIPAGFVISQDVEPGTKVKKGDTINVVISKGKEELPPITKTITEVIEVKDNGGDGTPTKVYVYIDDMDHDIGDAPYREYSLTETTTINFNMVIAPETKGRYVIVVNGTAIIDKEVNYEP